MIVRVEHREQPFAQIERATLQDERLSWRARGLLAYLLSLPADWHINFTDLARRSPGSAYQVRETFKELQEEGYAELKRPRGEGGVLKGSCWVVFEAPRLRDRQAPVEGAPSPAGSEDAGRPESRTPAPSRPRPVNGIRPAPGTGGNRTHTDKTLPLTDTTSATGSHGGAAEAETTGQQQAAGDAGFLEALVARGVYPGKARALVERLAAGHMQSVLHAFDAIVAQGRAVGPGLLVRALEDEEMTLYEEAGAAGQGVPRRAVNITVPQAMAWCEQRDLDVRSWRAYFAPVDAQGAFVRLREEYADV